MLKLLFEKSQVKIWEWKPRTKCFSTIDEGLFKYCSSWWLVDKLLLFKKTERAKIILNSSITSSLFTHLGGWSLRGVKTSLDALQVSIKHWYFFSKILSGTLTRFVQGIQVETTVLLMGLLGETWLLPLGYLGCRRWPISCLRKEHEDRLRSYWVGKQWFECGCYFLPCAPGQPLLTDMHRPGTGLFSGFLWIYMMINSWKENKELG